MDQTTGSRLYEDFEPYCRWHTKEGRITLEINLKGFKKEQLKVQTDNSGILRIHGERLAEASTNKWSRFHKEIKISKGCDVNAIKAKMSNGVLFIEMPKNANMGEGKHFIYGVETRKGTTIKVALGVVATVALGSYIARVISCKYIHS